MTKPRNIAEQVASATKKDEAAAAKQAEETARLREAVRNGKATLGDRVKDFFFACTGDAEHKACSPTQEIEKKLIGKKGELVLLISREEKGTCHTFGRGWSNTVVSKNRLLGILSGEGLVLDMQKSKAGLPTTKHVYVDHSRLPIDEGVLWVGYHTFGVAHNITHLSEHVHADDGSHGKALEIFVGDKEVFAYEEQFLFQRKQWILYRNHAIRRLGRELPFAPEEVEERKQNQINCREALNKRRDNFRRYSKGDHGYSEAVKSLREALTWAEELDLNNDPLVILIRSELGSK